ncbi:hypothetical protein VW29_03795 [Devosia limi DSM 17137]|uniref:Lipoprotein-anchoring transpeptidase ErfK/SrfK n=2 Tax=Devosia TaxID=46913 RepID=A0A0F5LV24_9HYPH|nr:MULTISPECIES: L,D-transpeptidase [Devosia]MBU1334337.1 L,D-transpeptidase [Alphaproteobacteria bacterium]KFL29733.1 hypothetical protein JP75_19215 [Devosia riboflavina]KKB86183.1 hypothetical protein VW29_03795 [Devosia limi DSM 17137]MBU1559681.1 L,D-transpeptidase [Alphaproteobacteria bacterium]MBU2305060.1 L,D-transpeptidase [Alphaproteobacteria bacterium]
MSETPFNPSRRAFVMLGGTSLALLAAGCTTTTPQRLAVAAEPIRPIVPPDVAYMYRAMPEEKFPIPAADIAAVDPKYWRQRVPDPTGEKPGSVVVHTADRLLYHVHDDGMATRYGAGIGRAGFEWAGRAHIAYKREWPVWTPPESMIMRQPELEIYREGQPPGIENALGARALYIHQGNKDTLYRVHSSGDEASIGQAVSSGCVRLLHQDVIHLANAVRDGSPILVV